MTGQNLYYKNCKCRKIIVDKLLEECSKNIDENEMILSAISLNYYGKVCNSRKIYIILFVIFPTIR